MRWPDGSYWWQYAVNFVQLYCQRDQNSNGCCEIIQVDGPDRTCLRKSERTTERHIPFEFRGFKASNVENVQLSAMGELLHEYSDLSSMWRLAQTYSCTCIVSKVVPNRGLHYFKPKRGTNFSELKLVEKIMQRWYACSYCPTKLEIRKGVSHEHQLYSASHCARSYFSARPCILLTWLAVVSVGGYVDAQ